MMPNLSQRSAKSTLGVPTASFAPILLNFGRFGATPGAQKEPLRVIWGGIFRFGVPFWSLVGAKGSQNRPFWRQGAPKVAKMMHKKGSQKKLEMLIEI